MIWKKYQSTVFVLEISKFHDSLSNSFPITKTNPFKVTKYKKVWWIFRPKWGKIKIFVIILSLLLKIVTMIHIKNTPNIQIKHFIFRYNRHI